MICTAALVSWQDIFQRWLGGWRWEGRSLLRLFHSLRPLVGLLRCRELFSLRCTVGPPDMALLRAPGTTPYLAALPSFVQSCPCFPVLPRTSLSSPGHPFPAGWDKKTKHRGFFCHQSHWTQCRTTWLIANPILRTLCVGKGFSVLLSHFIRDH